MSASTRYRSLTRSPTGYVRSPGSRLPAGAARTSWPAHSACRRGKSNAHSAKPVAGHPMRSLMPCEWPLTVTPRSKVVRMTVGTRLSGRCSPSRQREKEAVHGEWAGAVLLVRADALTVLLALAELV